MDTVCVVLVHLTLEGVLGVGEVRGQPHTRTCLPGPESQQPSLGSASWRCLCGGVGNPVLPQLQPSGVREGVNRQNLQLQLSNQEHG